MMAWGKMDTKINIRKSLLAIWKEFVHNSGLVALGDVSALYALSIILNIQVDISFFIVLILSILAINYFNRYKEADQDILTNSERSTSVKKYFKFTPCIMAALGLAAFVITWIFASVGALIFMVILFGQGIIYTLFLKQVTKKIIGFKNFMTALPYGLLIFFLSIFYDVPISSATILMAIFYFLRIFINTTFFDIKDIESDSKEGLKTFAAVVGEQGTKGLLLVINVLSLLPIVLGLYLGVLPIYSIGLLATFFYVLLYLKDRNKLSRDNLYGVLVDSEFVFWLPYVFLLKSVVG